jgi:hypothetical protein
VKIISKTHHLDDQRSGRSSHAEEAGERKDSRLASAVQELRPALTFLKFDKGRVSCLLPASVQISCMGDDECNRFIAATVGGAIDKMMAGPASTPA